MSKRADVMLTKELPEYLDEFFVELKKQIIVDNERWGNTWKERGLIWNNQTQEERFFDWVHAKMNEHRIFNEPFPWTKVAGEAMIGYIREKYLKESDNLD
jgi:hypothetical protein